MNFERTGDSKKSLDVGNAHYYREMWIKEMKEGDLYSHLRGWLDIHYSDVILNHQTGVVEFSNFDPVVQEREVVLEIPLENLVREIREYLEQKEKKRKEYEAANKDSFKKIIGGQVPSLYDLSYPSLAVGDSGMYSGKTGLIWKSPADYPKKRWGS